MRVFIKTTEQGRIIQILDSRDERFEYIINNIDLDGFIEVDIDEEQVTDIAAGEPYDLIGKEVLQHIPTEEEVAQAHKKAMLEAQNAKLLQIDAYDTGPAVNSFYFENFPMWLDRDSRVSFSRTIEIEAAAGRTMTELWNNEVTPPMRLELPIVATQKMLSLIEIYAKDCFNVTQAHRAAVFALESVQQIEQYDHTTGYPQKLRFSAEQLFAL